MVWDPKTKLVSPQFHVMFDDNFDTIQPPDPNIKHANTMDRLFRDNRYTYDDPFDNEHTYLFSHGGADIHPDNLTPTIETCQASLTATPGSDDMNLPTPTHRKTSILNMQDLLILHSNKIYPQNNKELFKSYKQLHGIDMQIHSITKPPLQKSQDMELSDLHHEELKIFAMEYNTPQQEPHNELDHFVNTLQQHNGDIDPGINDMFLNNLENSRINETPSLRKQIR
jgi:hypothetical protein